MWNNFNNQKKDQPLPSLLPLYPLCTFLSSLTFDQGIEPSSFFSYFPKPKLALLVDIKHFPKEIIKMLFCLYLPLHLKKKKISSLLLVHSSQPSSDASLPFLSLLILSLLPHFSLCQSPLLLLLNCLFLCFCTLV